MVEPIRLDYAANDAEVIAAFKRQQAELEKERKAREALQKQINDNAKTQKDADRQMAEGQREAQRVIEKSATAQQKYAAEVAKIEALHKKGHLTVEQYNQALSHQKATLDGSSKSSSIFGTALEGMTGKIAGVVSGFVSMQTVITFMKNEYDALLARQGKSADANISLAAEQEALLMNIGSEDAGAINEKIQALSRQRGVKQENVTRAVNDAMAARGDFSVQDVIDAVGSASKVRKFAPAELAGLASATVDTRKQTGLGTDEALGFLLQMQAQSRTKSLKELAANFTPAVGGIMQMGADRGTAGALLASLSHGMGDTSGAQTKTAALQLTSQLREFGGGAAVGDVIAQLQQNPAMREKFLSTMTSEVAARPAIESLLSGGKVAQQFSASAKALRENPLTALSQAEAARSSSAIKLAETDAQMANVTDQSLLSDASGAAASVIRTRMEELEASLPQNMKLASTVRSVSRSVRGGEVTPEQGLREMEQLVAMRRAGRTDKTDVIGWGANMIPGFGLVSDQVTQSMNRNDPEFDRQTKLLEEMVQLMQQNVDAAKNAKHAGIVGNRAANQKEGGL